MPIKEKEMATKVGAKIPIGKLLANRFPMFGAKMMQNNAINAINGKVISATLDENRTKSSWAFNLANLG